MARITNFRKLGDTILSRLQGLPPDLAKLVASQIAAFTAVHSKYSGLCAVADKDREARDLALEAVGKADKAVDAAVLKLANRMVGAELGTRKNAFADVSPYAPGALTGLAYDKLGPAVKDLAGKVNALKPPADVAAAVKTMLTAVAAFEAAQAAHSKAQTTFLVAMGARDTLLAAEWTKDFNRLKRHAQAAWLDLPGTWTAVFGRGGKVG